MTLPSRADVLIVGAGPTGLAAALFLAERGVRARIIDKNAGPSTTSRAQVVNPRSLELLEVSGVTGAILAEARPIHGMQFYEDWRPLAKIELAGLPSRYGMSGLPQSRTEALLAETLLRYGVAPERHCALDGVDQDEARVRAVLLHEDRRRETVEIPYMLAADGARSPVRQALGIPFAGHAFPEVWPLYDLRLEDRLDTDRAHICFVPGGLIFMLCLEPGLWRVFGNLDDVLTRLPVGARPGPVVWQSSFHIGDKVADKIVVGRVALAGDAAHIHSPIGARGMNLGIEDAFVYAACLTDALRGKPTRLADYARLRHPIHTRVVGRMDKLTRLARGQPGWVGALRHYLIPTLSGFGPSAHLMRDFVTGLDHPVRTA